MMPTSKTVKPTQTNGTRTPSFEITEDGLIVSNNENLLSVSLDCPSLRIGDGLWGSTVKRLEIQGDLSREKPVEVIFEPFRLSEKASLEVRLFIQWYSGEKVLRKWAKIKLSGDSGPIVLKEVILDCVNLAHDLRLEFNPTPSFGIKPGQSFPAFFTSFFAGIEYPAASTRLEDKKLILAHKPGVKLTADQWYETRKAVYGICPAGQEKSAFFEYLAHHHAASSGFHINYNNWWTSPIQYTENDILGLMQILKENLYDRHSVSFDSLCFDMGWSNDQSIWEIDKKLFPDGFSRLNDLAAQMGSSLGLWVSPGACYDPALNHEWAKAQGYEAAISIMAEFNHLKVFFVCLAGEKYRNEFLKNIVQLVETYQIRQVKLDGLLLECMQEDHGHEPGAYSSEAIAAGAIEVLTAIRQVLPDVWLESTCFGWNPSPWWLFYVDSSIGAYGTDAPFGRIPCPVFRESYTTARDFFNLQGAVRIPIPISSQEVLGIIHQTPDCFMNDAVMTVMRGHSFLPVYINPKYMNETRWEKFASLLKWARRHAPMTKRTEALLPASWQSGDCPEFTNDATMPREPYGYAHWAITDGNSLVALRNPWIKPSTYPLKLPISLNEVTGDQPLNIVSLYPEVRTYAQDLVPGGLIDIPLAPYETIVLSIGTRQPGSEEALEPGKMQQIITVNYSKHTLRWEKGKPSKVELAPDDEPNEVSSDYYKLDLDISLEIRGLQADILIFLEGDSAIPPLSSSAVIDGAPSTFLCSRSEDGWTASTLPAVEHWLILQAPILGGKHKVQITAAISQSVKQLSAWCWATRPGQLSQIDDPDVLPQPERISLEAAALIEPMEIWKSHLKD
jgi:hypothetical protein